MTLPLVLASTSVYRAQLLARLRLPFEIVAPGIDETASAGEAPPALARRLAAEKARAVSARHPTAIVIGSDQVAEIDGAAIGKPGTHERAREQLARFSGREAAFHTAVCVVRGEPALEAAALAVVQVVFRTLTSAEIERYLLAEQPYDCAGSARCEGAGIALLDAIRSDDPTALVGLPLIRTCRLLRAAGLDPLGPPDACAA